MHVCRVCNKGAFRRVPSTDHALVSFCFRALPVLHALDATNCVFFTWFVRISVHGRMLGVPRSIHCGNGELSINNYRILRKIGEEFNNICVVDVV